MVKGIMIKEFSEWLLSEFPHNAVLVTTNSRALHNSEVEIVTPKMLEKMIFLKENPTMDLKPVNGSCVVIEDENMWDY